MKNIFTPLIILFSATSFSQVINVLYTSNSLEGGVCVEEKHMVTLSENRYTRFDFFDKSTITEYVEIRGTGYDDAGLYWEVWFPIIPENVNEDNIDKITKGRRIIKVYFLSRRKDVMSITEVYIDTKQERYFFTKLAGGILCEVY